MERKMEENKKFEPDDPEQSARFIELAEQILGEDAEERLDEAMKRIAVAAERKKVEKASNAD